MSYATLLQPSLSAILFTALGQVNMDHAADKANWGRMAKCLRLELARALCCNMDQANSSREALKRGGTELKKEREANRVFRATAHDQLAGEM